MDVSTYLAEGGTDIYCDLLVPRRVPVEVVFESPTIIAFWHSRPTHEYHFVVAPKRHVADIRSPDTDAIWAADDNFLPKGTQRRVNTDALCSSRAIRDSSGGAFLLLNTLSLMPSAIGVA